VKPQLRSRALAELQALLADYDSLFAAEHAGKPVDLIKWLAYGSRNDPGIVCKIFIQTDIENCRTIWQPGKARQL
jgi:hypothetical protein